MFYDNSAGATGGEIRPDILDILTLVYVVWSLFSWPSRTSRSCAKEGLNV